MGWDESLFYFPNLEGNSVGISLIVMHVPVYYYLIDRRETAPTDECSPEMTFVLTPSSNCIRIPRDGRAQVHSAQCPVIYQLHYLVIRSEAEPTLPGVTHTPSIVIDAMVGRMALLALHVLLLLSCYTANR